MFLNTASDALMIYLFKLLQVYTIDDQTEMEVFLPSAKETFKFYDQVRHSYLDLKAKMEASMSKVVLHSNTDSPTWSHEHKLF